MLLVFYCLDKAKRFKLSREAKNKAENHWRREYLEVHPCCQGWEGGWGEEEKEEGSQGEDQGDWRARETEEDGGEGEQENGAKMKHMKVK